MREYCCDVVEQCKPKREKNTQDSVILYFEYSYLKIFLTNIKIQLRGDNFFAVLDVAHDNFFAVLDVAHDDHCWVTSPWVPKGSSSIK